MSQCAQCGAEFSCGMVDEPRQSPCWCTALPPLAGVPLQGSCLCQNCLRERLVMLERGREAPDGQNISSG